MMGWVTNVTEYSSATTINDRMSVTETTTKAQMRTSICSADRRWLGWLGEFNFLLQDRGHQVIWASLLKLANRLLALRLLKVVRILAKISVVFIAASQQQQRNY